jgi:hypothetical protein
VSLGVILYITCTAHTYSVLACQKPHILEVRGESLVHFRVRGNKTCSSPQTSYPDGMASIRRGLAALVRGVCSVAGSSVEWELQLTRSSSICVLVDCHKWSILLVKGGFKDFAMLAVFPQHSAPNRSLSSRLPSPLVIHLQQEQVS